MRTTAYPTFLAAADFFFAGAIFYERFKGGFSLGVFSDFAFCAFGTFQEKAPFYLHDTDFFCHLAEIKTFEEQEKQGKETEMGRYERTIQSLVHSERSLALIKKLNKEKQEKKPTLTVEPETTFTIGQETDELRTTVAAFVDGEAKKNQTTEIVVGGYRVDFDVISVDDENETDENDETENQDDSSISSVEDELFLALAPQRKAFPFASATTDRCNIVGVTEAARLVADALKKHPRDRSTIEFRIEITNRAVFDILRTNRTPRAGRASQNYAIIKRMLEWYYETLPTLFSSITVSFKESHRKETQ